LQRIVCLHAEELIDLGGISAAFCLPFIDTERKSFYVAAGTPGDIIALLPTAPEAPASVPAAPHAQAEPVGGITEEMVDAAIDAFDNFPCPMNGSAVRGISKNQMQVGLEAAIRIAAPVPQEAEQAAPAAVTDYISDKGFLQWVHDRMRFVHGENENYDYMHKLRAIIAAMPAEQKTPNVVSIADAQPAEHAATDRQRMLYTEMLDLYAKNRTLAPGLPLGAQPAAPAVTEAEQASVLAARAADFEEVIDALCYSLQQVIALAQDGLKPKQSSPELRMQFKRIINTAAAGCNAVPATTKG
jgi:hypothetical protein